jgi:hypothetical protein
MPRVGARPEPRTITYADWEPYLPPFPDSIDEADIPAVANLRRRVAERHIKIVSQSFDDFKNAWPGGSVYDFVLALELYKGCDDDILLEFQNPNFIRKVLQEGQTRGLHSRVDLPAPSLKTAPPVMPLDDSDSDDDSDDESRSRRQRHRPDWCALDMWKFRAALNEYAGRSPDWRAIAKRFPGKSPDDCRHLYVKMKRSNQIPSDFLEVPHEREDRAAKFRDVMVVRFCYKQFQTWVGPQSQKLRNAAVENPFKNYIDQVSNEKIVYPAVSPGMYLLDYNTWLKVILESGQDPFSRQKLTKRSLVLVTRENLRDFVHKIRNLEASRPPDPADDHLAEVLEELNQMDDNEDH